MIMPIFAQVQILVGVRVVSELIKQANLPELIMVKK
jgi:hypothetical protein